MFDRKRSEKKSAKSTAIHKNDSFIKIRRQNDGSETFHEFSGVFFVSFLFIQYVVLEWSTSCSFSTRHNVDYNKWNAWNIPSKRCIVSLLNLDSINFCTCSRSIFSALHCWYRTSILCLCRVFLSMHDGSYKIFSVCLVTLRLSGTNSNCILDPWTRTPRDSRFDRKMETATQLFV